MWLLFLVATIGMVALGLVVVNAGALFRIRYVFWMLLIVLAVEGDSSLNRLANQSHKLLNVVFARIERSHESHLRNLFVPNVKKILLL